MLNRFNSIINKKAMLSHGDRVMLRSTKRGKIGTATIAEEFQLTAHVMILQITSTTYFRRCRQCL